MHALTSLILRPGDPAPTAASQDGTTGPIGTVRWNGDNVVIQSQDPAQLLLAAEALTDAARQLTARLDTAAAVPA